MVDDDGFVQPQGLSQLLQAGVREADSVSVSVVGYVTSRW